MTSKIENWAKRAYHSSLRQLSLSKTIKITWRIFYVSSHNISFFWNFCFSYIYSFFILTSSFPSFIYDGIYFTIIYINKCGDDVAFITLTWLDFCWCSKSDGDDRHHLASSRLFVTHTQYTMQHVRQEVWS